MFTGSFISSIFDIRTETEFSEKALAVFRYQAKENKVYNTFITGLGIDPARINTVEHIPYLPVELFKSHRIVTGEWKEDLLFTSSGTTGQITSRHYVKEAAIYKKSFAEGFRFFYGSHVEYSFLALLPSYLEREGSSLVYMAEKFVNDTKARGSSFFLYNHSELVNRIAENKKLKQKTVLLGVTFALLDLAEKQNIQLSEDCIVMETGGMKGRRKEMIREELHQQLTESFGVSRIHSEYGMTELLSQAYSKGEGIFACPPWMKVSIRDVYDPLSLLSPGKRGGVNIIDLANIYSCSFIATQDIGVSSENGDFQILGRFDNSDIRGCNLLIS